MADTFGILVHADSGLGILHRLTGTIAQRQGNISSVSILEESPGESRIYFEIEMPGDSALLVSDFQALPIVREVHMEIGRASCRERV